MLAVDDAVGLLRGGTGSGRGAVVGRQPGRGRTPAPSIGRPRGRPVLIGRRGVVFGGDGNETG